MPHKIITPSLVLSLSIIFFMTCFSLIGTQIESLLEFNREKIIQGEYWRLLSGNLVHYGFFHLAMNAAAFIIISFSLLRDIALKMYITLLMICTIAVTAGIFVLDTELSFYRGFSGALHGLIVAGLLFNTFRNRWLSYSGVALVFAKIIYEHQENYHETQLQELLPVAVAYDAHLYGAVAGLIVGVAYLVCEYINKQNNY